MALIEKTDIMHLGFLKKESFTGSSEGMRYRMSKVVYKDPDTELLKKIEAGEADYPVDKKTGEKIMNPTKERLRLGVWVWPEPFSFDKTPEDKKLYKELAFDEAGVMEGLAWLNAQKSENDWTELRISWKDRP
ncbi:hypothetical protein SAMN05216349_102253 [Oribacterium sp. KHPX15]|uniref:hypothetical protein n=1 Tax=Oribacterium sp. KHPX15 TaxID=1855342 RepID=UPI00089D77A3|nr:hypothetical protein [Oribacterium sp. KHPX15]SDZ91752.1 hypothetical protein SAMN05216349_102253 [Oribacterium sp. KHPX15]